MLKIRWNFTGLLFAFLIGLSACIPFKKNEGTTIFTANLPTPILVIQTRIIPDSITFTRMPTSGPSPAMKFNSWEIVHDLAYSPDGKYLAVSAGSRIHIYDIDELEEITDIQVGAWTNRIAFHPNLPIIILAVKDGTIQFREIFSDDLVCQFRAHEKGANSLAIHPDGNLLITTGTDITSQLWDISSMMNDECSIDEIGTFIGESYSSPDAAFSPDGNSIALVDLSNIRLRKTTNRKLIALIESELPIFDITFSPDGRWLSAAQHRDSVTLWDLTHADNPVAMVLQPPKGDLEVFSWRVAFSPDSKMLAAGASDGSITIWDLPAMNPIETFHLPRAVSALAFSADGRHLSAGGLDSAVWLFPIEEE